MEMIIKKNVRTKYLAHLLMKCIHKKYENVH